MFRRENGHEQRLARPQQRPLRTIAAEPQKRAHADRMERHADRERRAQRKPLRNGVQAVRAVVVGVLQGIDDVESPAPRQHEQRQHARLPVETPRQGDVGTDGRDRERQPQHQMRRPGEAFAIAVTHDDGQRHGRQQRRQAVDRRSARHEEQSVDRDERQRPAGRDHAGGNLPTGRAGIRGIDAPVGPAVESHGRIACEDHAQHHLHQRHAPPQRYRTDLRQRIFPHGIGKGHECEGHGENRVLELHQTHIVGKSGHFRKG